MDLVEQLIQAWWLKQSEGWRELADNETRDSQAPDCSHQLYYDKKYPEEKPVMIPRLNVEYTIDEHGIVTLKNGKALGGTFMHEAVQDSVEPHPDFINAEDLVSNEIVDNLLGIKFKQSGHVDIDFVDTTTGKRIKTIVDIKTVGMNVFPGIVGKRNAPEYGYTYWKREASWQQANEYAIRRNVPYYYIFWISRDAWQFKLEKFDTDNKTHEKIVIKLADVNNCLIKSEEEGKQILPKFTGVCFCELGKNGKQIYCRHHKLGTTTRDGLPSEKSPANCPGKTKLLQALQHKDLLEELEDFEGEY